MCSKRAYNGATIQFLQGKMPNMYPEVVARDNKTVANLLKTFISSRDCGEESDAANPLLLVEVATAQHPKV